MRYDADSSAFVVDDDTCLPVRFFINESYTFPAGTFERHGDRELSQETRVVRGTFENRWSLSIVWGSMTYGSNYDHPHGGFDYANHKRLDPRPFMEEPETVEVAIIAPEPYTKPSWTMAAIGELEAVEVPEIQIELWGDPLGYINAVGLRWLMRLVSHFDSHAWKRVKYGPELHLSHQGHLGLEVEYVDGSKEVITLVGDGLYRHAATSRDGLD